MKRDIILAGVGGQGLLALAAVIGEAARSLKLHVLQAEVHGMAQRGGVVQSHLRYSDRPIHSALIKEGTAHLILSLEPMEALRYLPHLTIDGAVITNSVPFKNIPDYPDEVTIEREISHIPNHRLIDAVDLAKAVGAIQAANMVMLGAGAPFLELPLETLEAGIRTVFAGKLEAVIEINLRAFRLGLEASEAAA
ncbi:MAG: indolepyruvate oxidoreductase subunit beta [Candidatus Bipolaricaulota bacterium]